MANPLVEVQKFGQSIWYDNIRRGIITSGELQSMIDQDGLLGITSNPAIFEKAINDSHDYDQAIRAAVAGGSAAPVDVYEGLAMDDIRWAADLMHPVWNKTSGRDGWVSFEVLPQLANDTEGTVKYARRAHAAIGRDNVLIKVPATPAGMPAIATLIGEGISVNVTLLFAVSAYDHCANAYMEGLERAVSRGVDVSRIASVASFFVSRIDSMVDEELDRVAAAETDAGRKGRMQALRGKIAIANAKLAYAHYLELVGGARWKALAAKGARTQRVLWASTSTKNAAYPKTLYVDSLIARDTVNTIPEETFVEYRRSGKPHAALEQGWDAQLAEAKAQVAELESYGISLASVTDRLLDEGVRKFVQPMEKLLAAIEKKREALKAA
ncbi:MAG: transaldolase [Alphaproteobacteria bacterium]